MTIKNQPKVNEVGQNYLTGKKVVHFTYVVVYKQVLVGEDALLKRVKSMEQENMKLRKKLEEVRLWKLFWAQQ